MLLFPIPFIGFGYIAIRSGVIDYKLSKASLNWPTTDGIISSAWLSESRSHNTNKSGSTKVYEPKVKYEYEVRSKKYVGNKIFFSSYSSSNKKKMSNILSKYPTDEFIKVIFNPHDPQISILDSKISLGTKLLIICGSLFVLFGIVVGIGISQFVVY